MLLLNVKNLSKTRNRQTRFSSFAVCSFRIVGETQLNFICRGKYRGGNVRLLGVWPMRLVYYLLAISLLRYLCIYRIVDWMFFSQNLSRVTFYSKLNIFSKFLFCSKVNFCFKFLFYSKVCINRTKLRPNKSAGHEF